MGVKNGVRQSHCTFGVTSQHSDPILNNFRGGKEGLGNQLVSVDKVL